MRRLRAYFRRASPPLPPDHPVVEARQILQVTSLRQYLSDQLLDDIERGKFLEPILFPENHRRREGPR